MPLNNGNPLDEAIRKQKMEEQQNKAEPPKFKTQVFSIVWQTDQDGNEMMFWDNNKGVDPVSVDKVNLAMDMIKLTIASAMLSPKPQPNMTVSKDEGEGEKSSSDLKTEPAAPTLKKVE